MSQNNRRHKRFGWLLGPKGGPTYAEILRDIYGASEIYPLVNIASGTNIPAFVNAAHDGTLAGWDLKNAAGPVTGTLAPYSDGTNGTDYGNIGSVGLIWNGAIGSMVICGKVTDAADWSDGASRKLVNYKVNNDNMMYLGKHGTLGLEFYVAIGGHVVLNRITPGPTGWFMIGLTWKDSANGDSVIKYYNGAQQGVALTGWGAWTGVPTIYTIGAAYNEGDAVWKGWLGYHALKFGSIWTPTEMAAMYADLATGGPDVNP